MFKCNVIDFFETYEVVLMSHQKIHVDETPLVTLLDQASYHGNIEDYIGLKVTLKYPNLENVLTAGIPGADQRMDLSTIPTLCFVLTVVVRRSRCGELNWPRL